MEQDIVAVGTFVGGWRIINTLAHCVTDIEAPQGFTAETSFSPPVSAVAPPRSTGASPGGWRWRGW
jgi:hypothetical protein